jgi:hypothetical protein
MARTKNVNGVEVALTSAEETARNQEEKSFADGATQRNILGAIHRLESAISSRRYREAIAGSDGGWLANQESLIAAERGKL